MKDFGCVWLVFLSLVALPVVICYFFGLKGAFIYFGVLLILQIYVKLEEKAKKDRARNQNIRRQHYTPPQNLSNNTPNSSSNQNSSSPHASSSSQTSSSNKSNNTNLNTDGNRKERIINDYSSFSIAFQYVINNHGKDLIYDRRLIYFLNDFLAFKDHYFLKDLFTLIYDEETVLEILKNKADIKYFSHKYSTRLKLEYYEVYDFLVTLELLISPLKEETSDSLPLTEV